MVRVHDTHELIPAFLGSKGCGVKYHDEQSRMRCSKAEPPRPQVGRGKAPCRVPALKACHDTKPV
jgi:hypothetical protein